MQLLHFARIWAMMGLLAIVGLTITTTLPENLSSLVAIEIADLMEEQQEGSDHLDEKDFQLITEFFSENVPVWSIWVQIQRLGTDSNQYLNWGYGGIESPPPRNQSIC